MQKAAPNHPAASPGLGPCPTDEEVAAYIDGGLDRVERERVAGHLASCEECLAVFSMTARLLAEPGPASREDQEIDEKILAFPSRFRRLAAQWGSVAAILLAGLGVGTYYQFLASPPSLVTNGLTSSIHGQQGLVKQSWEGGTTARGEEPGRSFRDASFQLGVQLVDLQVTLAAGDSNTAAIDILPRIHRVLESQAGFSDLEPLYAEIRESLLAGPVQPAVLEKAQQIAIKARDYADERNLDLGQWVEAGRLASLLDNPAFFQQSNSRSFLRRLLWRDRLGIERDFKLDPSTRTSLEKISSVLGKGDLTAADYAEIQRETEKILETYYPQV